MNLTVFEDRQVALLHPITVGRPAYLVLCGGVRLIDRLLSFGDPLRCVVRPHLREVQKTEISGGAERDPESFTLAVNARVVPSQASLALLTQLRSKQCGLVVRHGKSIAAALIPPEYARAAEAFEFGAFEDYLADLPLEEYRAELPLIRYPHDVIREHLAILPGNLEEKIATGNYLQKCDGLFVAEGVELGEFVAVDTTGGPVILDENVTIGPHAFLKGPAVVGANSRVVEYAAVKHGTAVGHTVKIGGEVEESVIEPYSNKQHHGFLGHSYLGSWVNLGAGTSVSDLKNTYGQINMRYQSEKIATDMQFLGCIVGDYAKAAVNTSIFTGKTIGVCSMLYGFVTTNVPSFVNYARTFGQVSEVPVEVMIATQARMFARRNVTLRPADIDLLRAMHDLTAAERTDEGEPLSSEPLSL